MSPGLFKKSLLTPALPARRVYRLNERPPDSTLAAVVAHWAAVSFMAGNVSDGHRHRALGLSEGA